MADCSCAKVVLSKEHPQLLTTSDAVKRDQDLVVAADHSDRHSANVVTKQWTRANSIISTIKHDLQNYLTNLVLPIAGWATVVKKHQPCISFLQCFFYPFYGNPLQTLHVRYFSFMVAAMIVSARLIGDQCRIYLHLSRYIFRLLVFFLHLKYKARGERSAFLEETKG